MEIDQPNNVPDDGAGDDCSMVSVLSHLSMSSDVDDENYLYSPPSHDYRNFPDDEMVYDDDDDLYSPNILARCAMEAMTDLGPMKVEDFAVLVGDRANTIWNWTPLMERLESHPEDALNDYLPSDAHASQTRFFSHREGMELVFHRVLRHEISNAAERRLPPEVIKAFLKANPLLAKIYMQGYLPLTYCINRVIGKIGGTQCFIHAQSINGILDAYPEAAQEKVSLEYNRSGLPLHLLCQIGSQDFGRLKALSRSVISEYALTVQKLIEAYPSSILEKCSAGFLPINYISRGAWPNKSNAKSAAIVRKKSEWRDAMFGIYVVVLRATFQALNPSDSAQEIDRKLLWTAMKFTEKKGGAVSVLVDKMPQLAKCRDEDGDYPLCTAAGTTNVSDDMIEVLMQQNPAAIRIADKNGRLPLHITIDKGRSTKLIDAMIAAEPRAFKVRDMKSRLYPFMSAAIDDNYGIDTVYSLLRKDPTLASGLAEDAPWVKTDNAMHQLEKDRDEWKRKYEEVEEAYKDVQAENEKLKRRIASLESAS